MSALPGSSLRHLHLWCFLLCSASLTALMWWPYLSLSSRLGMLSQGQSSGNHPSPSLGHRWMGNAVKIGCEQGQGVRHTVVWSWLHGTDSSRSLMEPQLGNGSFIPAFQASPGRCRYLCRNQQVRLSSSIAFFKPFVCKHMQSTTPHIVKGNSHLFMQISSPGLTTEFHPYILLSAR